MIDGTSASAAEVTAVASVLWEKDKTKVQILSRILL